MPPASAVTLNPGAACEACSRRGLRRAGPEVKIAEGQNLNPAPKRAVWVIAVIFEMGENAIASYSPRRNTWGMTITSSPPPTAQPYINACDLLSFSLKENGMQGAAHTQVSDPADPLPSPCVEISPSDRNSEYSEWQEIAHYITCPSAKRQDVRDAVFNSAAAPARPNILRQA